jgi:hypothetical protein
MDIKKDVSASPEVVARRKVLANKRASIVA